MRAIGFETVVRFDYTKADDFPSSLFYKNPVARIHVMGKIKTLVRIYHGCPFRQDLIHPGLDRLCIIKRAQVADIIPPDASNASISKIVPIDRFTTRGIQSHASRLLALEFGRRGFCSSDGWIDPHGSRFQQVAAGLSVVDTVEQVNERLGSFREIAALAKTKIGIVKQIRVAPSDVD